MKKDVDSSVQKPTVEHVKLYSKTLYKKLLENTTDAVFIVDFKGNHLEANKQWCTFLGRDFEEILGLSVWDVMHKDHIESCKNTMSKLLAGIEIPLYTRDFVRKDGSIVTGEMNVALIDDNQDGLKFVLGVVKDITKWKETEKVIRSTEMKYRHLLENIPQRIFYKNIHSIYVACNPAYAQDLGISPADIPGKTDYDFFSREMAETYQANDRKVLDTLEIYRQDEPYFIHGQERITHIQKCPVFDDEGNVIGVLGIFWDVTDRENTKRSLEKSEKRYRMLYENLTEGLYQMDNNGIITWASQIAADIFGKTPEEVEGTHISEYVHPDERDITLAALRKTITSGEAVSEGIEIKGKRDDGSIFYYRVKNKVLEEDDKIVGIQGLIRDVTEFRISQNALEASEERYRTFAESFQGIAFRGTLDWIPEFFHGSVEAITGYTEDEFTSGTPRWDQVIHPEDKEEVFKIGENLAEVPNFTLNRKYRIIKKNGEIRWLHEFTSNMCDESGKPKWVQGSIYDISDVVLAEKTLKRFLNDLEIYASLLQHDLRNDLQVLLNQSEISLLMDGMPEDEEKYWKIVEGTSHSMIRLLDVFLKPSEFYEHAITTLIDILVRDIKKTYPDLQIDLKFDVLSSEFTVIGSRLLPCVFDNLFRNVVEHVGPNSVVIINVRIENNQAVIDFSDNGPGVDRTIISKLFQKGISTTGGGYGLYLSRKIIEAYEGTIEVVRTEEEGTTFRITLPSI
ncbi:MAG: PAS domain S-box protein [Candidatus Thorarchaeota archaeon]|nr:MAG: PAS domain S-box protein [Candidatus Thorarchaeota archaeon]